MSKARDISNLFSASTDVATDAEINSAIANHASNTTNRHYKVGNSSSRPGSPNVGDIYTNTETGFIEIYESTGWSQVGGIASAPSSVVATNQGSGRAYNNGQASIAFSAGTIPGKTYTVTSSPGSYTNTGSSSPIVVTGLQSSTQYTYSVTATNNYGTSAASAASAGVTATTVPQAPTIDIATQSQGVASVAFTPGATGGASVTYTATSNPGGLTGTSSSSPIQVPDLVSGTSYTFTVTATNSNGTSIASAASNSVLASVDINAITPLQLITVGPAGASSVSFTNIPSTYSHLQLRYIARTSRAINNDGLVVKFNSSNSGYNYLGGHVLYGNGSSASSVAGWIGSSTAGGAIGQIPGANLTSNIFGAGVVDILDYKNTNKNKTVKTFDGFDANGSGEVHLMSFSWDNTSAITSMEITVGTGQNFVANTQFALYGVKTA